MSHDILLEETLLQSGFSTSELSKLKVLQHSNESREGNERVHAATNQTIFDLLTRNELGRCIHVTGGARALTDPYHRMICEAMQGKDQDPFKVLYYVPKQSGDTGWSIVKWNLSQWGLKGFSDWRQKILTLNMIGSEAVDLKAFDERDSLQFSVFGNRYAQIQSHHSDHALSKHVWLVESENVNGRLTEMADNDLSTAREIEEQPFAKFVSALYSNSARRMFLMLSENSLLGFDDFMTDSVVSFLDPNPRLTLEALQVMDFISSRDDHTLMVTADGNQFMKSI